MFSRDKTEKTVYSDPHSRIITKIILKGKYAQYYIYIQINKTHMAPVMNLGAVPLPGRRRATLFRLRSPSFTWRKMAERSCGAAEAASAKLLAV